MLLLTIAAALGAISPTYLACQFPSAGEPFLVEISVNEDQGSAVIAIPSASHIVTRSAIFTPSEVRIKDDESMWTINRSTLAIVRALSFGPQPNTNTGKCEVKPAPEKRAF